MLPFNFCGLVDLWYEVIRSVYLLLMIPPSYSVNYLTVPMETNKLMKKAVTLKILQINYTEGKIYCVYHNKSF